MCSLWLLGVFSQVGRLSQLGVAGFFLNFSRDVIDNSKMLVIIMNPLNWPSLKFIPYMGKKSNLGNFMRKLDSSCNDMFEAITYQYKLQKFHCNNNEPNIHLIYCYHMFQVITSHYENFIPIMLNQRFITFIATTFWNNKVQKFCSNNIEPKIHYIYCFNVFETITYHYSCILVTHTIEGILDQ